MNSEQKSKNADETFNVFLTEYIDNIMHGLDERWEKTPVDLYDSVPFEVLGALIARQSSLAIELARAPQVWTPTSAPLYLRTMVEGLITIRWICGDFVDRAKKFYLYGLGQHKLQLEHNKLSLESDPDNKLLQEMVEMGRSWLESQRREFFTDVDVGAWAGKSVREMAKECDSEELYKFAYSGFSAGVHSTWEHLGKFNVGYCSNVLHKLHRVPIVPNDQPELDYLYRATKYIHQSFEAYDKFFKIDPETVMPLEWFSNQADTFKDAAEDEPEIHGAK